MTLIFYFWGIVFAIKHLYQAVAHLFVNQEHEEKKRENVNQYKLDTADIQQAVEGNVMTPEEGTVAIFNRTKEQFLSTTTIDIVWIFLGVFSNYWLHFICIFTLSYAMVKFRFDVPIKYAKYVFSIIKLLQGMIAAIISYQYFSPMF